jgi:Ca2+-binding EF-hand superfamily protein
LNAAAAATITAQEYDTNGDGMIERKELLSMLDAVGVTKPVAIKLTAQTFVADVDKDGKVSFEEFAEAHFRHQRRAVVRKYEKQFKLGDSDDNNAIDRKELQSMLAERLGSGGYALPRLACCDRYN